MYRGTNVRYEPADRVRAPETGGIGAMHRLAKQTGLVEAIDRGVRVLKVYLPYHESDHVLGLAYNALCGGTCLQDVEGRRQNEVDLDALGAQRIPDPTTGGDFCRRVDEVHIDALQDAINEVRVRVWQQQGEAFFEEAVIDADGTVAPTTGECKDGMDIAYNGVWGYHPLVVSLANTQEPLYLVNRSGNRPSSEGAAARFDQAHRVCRGAGFRRIAFRGDTDFSQTAHLDRWDGEGIRFLFGFDAHATLIARTERADLVFLANGRGHQENLIEPLGHGVHATRMPVDTLPSNWAYMVMTALAWRLKAWFALLLPEGGRWSERYAAEKMAVLSMEFTAFVNAFLRVPALVVRTSRRLVFRLVAWSPWQHVFLRAVDHLPNLQRT